MHAIFKAKLKLKNKLVDYDSTTNTPLNTENKSRIIFITQFWNDFTPVRY